MHFADATLARRLERAECAASVSSAMAREGPAFLNLAGGVAIFVSASSPFNAVKGIGLEGPVADGDLDAFESFFAERSADSFVIDVCPLADETLGNRLVSRGYAFAGFESVTYRPITFADRALETDLPDGLSFEIANVQNADEWALLMARGFSGTPEPPEFMIEISKLIFHTHGALAVAVRHGGRIVAGAGMNTHEGTAALFGAVTEATMQGRGIQRSLLHWRLRRAAESGCDLAKVDTKPGTTSQRNAERAGFRVAYTRAQFVRTSR